MNNIALNHRLALIRGTAVPLHERKERAAKEKERELTFEDKMKNALISHVTGADLSDDSDDEAVCEDNTLKYAIYNTHTAPPKTTTPDNSPASLNTSLKWYDNSEIKNLCPAADEVRYNNLMTDFREEKRMRTDGMARIQLGANELPQFMAELQKVKESGECLTAFLQKFIPEPIKDRTAVNWHAVKLPTQGTDVIWLNPKTGEVVHAQHSPPAPGLSSFSGYNLSFADREAQNDHVWDLAYDLQKFIQNAFFREEDSCADEIDKLLEEIKARQAEKCFERFNFVARLPSSTEIWFDNIMDNRN
jgi:hypothetical protein